MSDNKGKLIVFTEGGVHTLDYLNSHGIYPHRAGLRTDVFREIVPYLSTDTEILVIVKGLTDFSLRGIYAMLKDLEEHKEDLKSVTVMSNIYLGDIPFSYYLYTGDLMYSTLEKVRKGKRYSITGVENDVLTDNEDALPKKAKKKQDKNGSEKQVINPVISRYKVYNQRNALEGMYGTKKLEDTSDNYDRDVYPLLVNLNVFPN